MSNIEKEFSIKYKNRNTTKRIFIRAETRKNICSPFSGSSLSVIEAMRKFSFQNKNVLDMGCGCGILGIFVLLNGAKSITFADINRDAVSFAKENVILNGRGASRAKFYSSDLFDKIPPFSYDIILFNPPFFEPTKLFDKRSAEYKKIQWLKRRSILAFKTIYDPGYKTLERFFQDAARYLSAKGYILFAFSPEAGDLDLFKNIIKKYGYTLRGALHKKNKIDNKNFVHSFVYKLTKNENKTMEETR